jgi:hypothetical protein
MRFEDLIGQAILGDDQDKEDSMRRVSVKEEGRRQRDYSAEAAGY